MYFSGYGPEEVDFHTIVAFQTRCHSSPFIHVFVDYSEELLLSDKGALVINGG